MAKSFVSKIYYLDVAFSVLSFLTSSLSSSGVSTPIEGTVSVSNARSSLSSSCWVISSGTRNKSPLLPHPLNCNAITRLNTGEIVESFNLMACTLAEGLWSILAPRPNHV